MLSLAILVLAFLGMALLEVPGLLRRRLWRELAAFATLLAIGFTLSFLQVLGVRIPSPNEGIESLIKAIGQAISS